jgi:phosphatidate cytidylyltransferase
MLERGGRAPFKWLGLGMTLAVVWSLSGSAPRLELELPLVAGVSLATVSALWRRPAPHQMLDAVSFSLLPVALVGMPLAFLVKLRGLSVEEGADLLLLLFVCVILSDTAAYYVGGRFGRRRLAPSLSPKKSWEGACGGLLASIAGGLLAHLSFYSGLPLAHSLSLGLLLGIAAAVGDLCESMVKRATGVKDSSGLLPGHGGLLDRTDSVLLGGPLLDYYHRLFL